MPPSRLRALLPRLILLAVSGLFSLGVAELAIRLVRPQAVMLVGRGFYAPDEPDGYRLNPGFHGTITNRVEFETEVAIDRLGLRGGEVGAKVAGRPRILVLGDSFAFGVGAGEGESYPHRLEEELRRRGVEAEVLNAGVPGYGIPNAATWFERHGRALQPDLILLTSFLGNDFFDANPAQPKSKVVDGILVVEGEKHGGLSRWLYYHSHLFVALKSSTLGARIRALLGRPVPLDTRWSQAELDLLHRGDLSDLAERGGGPTDEGLKRLRAAAGRTPILLVLVPSVLQVDGAKWAAMLAGKKASPEDFDAGRLARWFKEGSPGAAGLPLYDASPAFARAIRSGEKIYFPIDQHLTPAGYALLGREVAEPVLRLLVAPPPSAAPPGVFPPGPSTVP